MARIAERDQVEFGVVTSLTSKLSVVDLQILETAAVLTPPIVSF
jgi:hypothetical protein